MSAILFKPGYGSSAAMEDTANGHSVQKNKSRLDWVDCAKGLCIILVVMLHSTRGVTEAVEREGLIQYFVAFAKPFRMPDFFMISGLFLAKVINRDWLTYLDRKVIHFVYFYVLWVTINFALKSPGLISSHGIFDTVMLYLQAFIQPLGTLWFIYLLPVFFVITKLLRKVQPVIIFAIAAILEVAVIETGWIVVDQTASRYIYFFTGYWLAPYIFNLAAVAQAKRRMALLGLVVWALINGSFVFAGYSEMPLVSLALGFIGAAAIVTIAALISTLKWANPVRYCGKNSIVIYLAFFLTMHTTQMILLSTGIIEQVSIMSGIVTAAGIIGPLVMWRLVRNTRLSFLFVRPAYFKLERSGAGASAPDSHQMEVKVSPV